MIVGVNVGARSNCGILVYNMGRLVRTYDKLARQESAPTPESVGAAGGVVVYVHMPVNTMHVALHRQGFLSHTQFRELCHLLDSKVSATRSA